MLSVEHVRKILSTPRDSQASLGLPLAFYPVHADAGAEEPHIVAEIDPAESFAYTPPRAVSGTPFDNSCLNAVMLPVSLPLKPKRLQRLERARIIGWEAVLDGQNRLYAPSLLRRPEEIKRIHNHTHSGHQGFVLQQEEDAYSATCATTFTPFVIDKPALFIGAPEAGNYGSFLFRVLPRLLMIPQLSINISYLVLPDRSAWMLEALRLLGITLPVLTPKETCSALFQELYLFADHENEGAFSSYDRERLERFAEMAAASAGPLNVSSRKFYVSRRLSTHARPHYRPITNEAAVEGFFARKGFEIVYPETHNFQRQIALFRHAELLVGPSGSGMLNACFARPGTKLLDMESFTHCVRQHAKIYCSTGKSYGFYFGQVDETDPSPAIFKRWTADIATIDATLVKL